MLAPRVRTLVGTVVVTVLLIGVGSYAFVRHMRVQQAELKSEEDRRAAEESERDLIARLVGKIARKRLRRRSRMG